MLNKHLEQLQLECSHLTMDVGAPTSQPPCFVMLGRTSPRKHRSHHDAHRISSLLIGGAGHEIPCQTSFVPLGLLIGGPLIGEPAPGSPHTRSYQKIPKSSKQFQNINAAPHEISLLLHFVIEGGHPSHGFCQSR